MGYNKDGSYRINLYFNPKLPKDKVIIDFLEERYAPAEYIKELLYSKANCKRDDIQYDRIDLDRLEISEENSFDNETIIDEPIKSLDDIEL